MFKKYKEEYKKLYDNFGISILIFALILGFAFTVFYYYIIILLLNILGLKLAFNLQTLAILMLIHILIKK